MTGDLPAHAVDLARRRAGRGEWDPHAVAVARDLDVDELVDQAVDAARPGPDL